MYFSIPIDVGFIGSSTFNVPASSKKAAKRLARKTFGACHIYGEPKRISKIDYWRGKSESLKRKR